MTENRPRPTGDAEFPWRLGGVELSADGAHARLTYRVTAEFGYTVDVRNLGLDVDGLYAGAADAAAEGYPPFSGDDPTSPAPVDGAGRDPGVLLAVLHAELNDNRTLDGAVRGITDLAEADRTVYVLANDTDPGYADPDAPRHAKAEDPLLGVLAEID